MKRLVINMHIFLAPKANNDLSGGARQFGAEQIYRQDSPVIVTVASPSDIMVIVLRPKATSMPFTDAFTV